MMASGPLSTLALSQGILIAAIYRGGEVIIQDGSTRIEEGDRVMILNLLSDIAGLEKLLKTR